MFEIIFWLGALVVLYVYAGYPLLLLLLSKIRPARPVQRAAITPTISLIIPAYNEAEAIGAKLENSLALDYPRECLEIIVASDGSTDGTNEIVEQFREQGVNLVALRQNRGKSAAENAAVAQASGEILVFADATGIFNREALHELVRPFADPRVGCVVGRVAYQNANNTATTEGEGVYWRYEVFIRTRESVIGNLAMASGSIMACRRSLVRLLPETVGEDFVLPLWAAIEGFRTVYQPSAVSRELIAETDTGMLKTKIRIVSKDLRGLFLCGAILNPLRYPLYAWGLVSHKLLRWLVPYVLIVLLIANLFLLDRPFYLLALVGQAAFYGLGLLGYRQQRGGKPSRLLGIPFSFCLVNLAALLGVARFLRGKTAGRWEPVRA